MSLASDIDSCQYRWVSISRTTWQDGHVGRPRTSLPVLRAGAGCCAPLRDAPLTQADADELARRLKALADPARLRLLSILLAAPNGEACTCELTEPLGLSQPTVSHHLKKLADAGLVSG